MAVTLFLDKPDTEDRFDATRALVRSHHAVDDVIGALAVTIEPHLAIADRVRLRALIDRMLSDADWDEHDDRSLSRLVGDVARGELWTTPVGKYWFLCHGDVGAGYLLRVYPVPEEIVL